MRLRSIAIAGAVTFGTLAATPPTLLGGAILAQAYAPDTLRFAVHTANGLGEEGLEAEELRAGWTLVRNTVDLNPVKTALAGESVNASADALPER